MISKILDTTLRDGNYVVDFQFTPKDIVEIASALESFGFEFIEIGHGLGLNASNCSRMVAAATDKEYMRSAASCLKRAKWGMFFIPDIGRLKDIDLAADHGMHFIRIGTNITESKKGLKYIKYARKRGMFVCANLMKSYAATPREFAIRAKMAEDAGADVVFLVDSAGGMFPDDIKKYYNTAKKATKVKLGVHAHNNLQLGIANSLTAVKCGAYMVDTCLQGLGRGGGNASTEVLVTTLSRQNLLEGLDLRLYDLLDFSENFVKPLLKQKGIDAVSLVSGYAQFHSSYLPIVKKYAERYKIDPRRLIVELCKIDVVNAPEVIVQQIADKLEKEKLLELPKRHFNKKLYEIIRETKETSFIKELDIILRDIDNLSRKFNKKSVFNIALPIRKKRESLISRLIQESSSFIIGTAEITNLNDLKNVLDRVDRNVDIIVYDAELKTKDSHSMFSFIHKNVKKATLLFYRNTDVWAKAIENAIIQLSKGFQKKILLVGSPMVTLKLAGALSDIGFKVFIYGDNTKDVRTTKVKFSKGLDFVKETNGKFDFIVGLGPRKNIVDAKFKNSVSKDCILVDGGIGTISSDMVDFALNKAIRIIRVDMRGELEAEIRSKISSYELVNNVAGRKVICNVECVAGGVYGKENSVVLDSIKNPANVIGLADGKGKVKYILKEKEKQIVKKIEQNVFLSKGAPEDEEVLTREDRLDSAKKTNR